MTFERLVFQMDGYEKYKALVSSGFLVRIIFIIDNLGLQWLNDTLKLIVCKSILIGKLLKEYSLYLYYNI